MDTNAPKPERLEKSHDILTCTIRNPEFAYAQMELMTDSTTASQNYEIDALQVKSYCTAALRQFLGLTGAGVPVDVLVARGKECWVRVPREDLGSLAAALTAWRGVSEEGVRHWLSLKQCSDWLGAMVGSDGQEHVWTS